MTRVCVAVERSLGSARNGRVVCFLMAAMLTVLAPMAESADGSLVVRIVEPQMNADVSDLATLVLAAETRASGSAIRKVEFFDGDKLIGTVTQTPFKLAYHPAQPQLNFRITARVADVAGRSATSPPVTCVATRRLQRQYRSYDYEETAEDMLKQVRLTIPDGLSTVRGILVVTNSAGGDSRDAYHEPWYAEFLYLHDFAFLGATGFTSHVPSLQVMTHALQHFAKEANHPELVNVPYVTTGFSAGGGFASRLVVEVPDRVIASVPICSRLNLPATPSPGTLATPACVITGELEKGDQMVRPVLETYRPKGALYAWMTVQGAGHARSAQEVLAMPWLDAAVRLRYPAEGDPRNGPVALRRIDPNAGWVADDTSWKSGLTSIVPAGQFKGDVGKTSWLPTEGIAFIYRAYATYDSPLTIVSPAAGWSYWRVWDPGSNVTIVVDDAGFPNWKKLEFYDGARRLGEVAQAPAQFTALDLSAGLHVFSVIGTNAQGMRSSKPVLVIVRKLPTRPAQSDGKRTP